MVALHTRFMKLKELEEKKIYPLLKKRVKELRTRRNMVKFLEFVEGEHGIQMPQEVKWRAWGDGALRVMCFEAWKEIWRMGVLKSYTTPERLAKIVEN